MTASFRVDCMVQITSQPGRQSARIVKYWVGAIGLARHPQDETYEGIADLSQKKEPEGSPTPARPYEAGMHRRHLELRSMVPGNVGTDCGLTMHSDGRERAVAIGQKLPRVIKC